MNNWSPITSNNGLNSSLINTMLGLGNGTWSNTGYSFDNASNVSLGYNGSYKSLNTALDGYINIPEIILKGNTNTWGNQIAANFNAYMDGWNEQGGWDSKKLTLDFGGGIYGALETTARPGNQWLGKNGKFYNKSWGGNQYTGTRSGAFKTASAYKWAGRATVGVSALIGVAETVNGYQMDGGQFGYNAQSAAFGTTGSLLGGWAGAEAGAWSFGIAGGLIGGPPGAVIGAVIGGFVGGFGGSYLGGNIGSGSVNYYHDR